MYQLRVKDHFDAAHYLEGYVGKCHELHGHRWEVEIVLQYDKLGVNNMLIDFKQVKEVLKVLLDKCLDHHCLNKTLVEENPTAEYLAKWIYENVGLCDLVSVTVWESPECSATYFDGGTTANLKKLFEESKIRRLDDGR